MDDDLFQFEEAREEAPQLVLGKKKKKKKKKHDNDQTDEVGDPTDNATFSVGEEKMGVADVDASSELSLTKTKNKKNKKDLTISDEVEGEPSSGPADDALTTGDSVIGLDLGLSKKKKKKKKSDQKVDYGNESPENSTTERSVPGDINDDVNGNVKDDAMQKSPSFDVDDSDLVGFDNEVGVAPTSQKKKKKKKKGATTTLVSDDFDGGDVLLGSSQLTQDPKNVDPPAETDAPLSAAEKKKAKRELDRKKKSDKALKEEEELNAILAELGDGPDPAQGSQDTISHVSNGVEPSTSSTMPLTAAQKKRLKKKKKIGEDKTDVTGDGADKKDDIDALLAELTVSNEAGESPSKDTTNSSAAAQGTGGVDDLLAELAGESSSATTKKKAKKKKKKAGADGDGDGDSAPVENEVNALLAELEGVDSSKPSAPADTSGGTLAEANVAGGVDDLLAELGEDGATASKKKAKKKKKKGGAKNDGAEETAETGDATENKSALSASQEPKKKKKESAIVRRAREQQERLQAEQERLQKLREEEEARILAEEKRKKEEARRKEEEKARKKAADKAKKERKRAEGTLLTKKEKEKRRRAEMVRKQFIESGMVPAANADDEPGAQERRSQVSRRKRTPRDSDMGASSVDLQGRSAEKSEQEDDMSETKPDDEPSTGGLATPVKPVENIIPDLWDNEDADISGSDKTRGPESLKNRGSSKAERSVPRSGVTNKDKDDDEEDDGDSEKDDSDEGSSDDDSEYEGMSKAEIAAEKRIEAFRKQRSKQREQAIAARTSERLRSPVICILGHVDTGKTKILDKIRRTNVQDGEAGGITQQIGATYFPIDAVKKEATKLKEGRELIYNVPSLLIIDTPGHESFTNLRSRGSSLCDIAILVVDIMHGLEPQTRESIDLLKLRKTPFIVALNKIDRIYDWHAQPHNCPSAHSLEKQPKHAQEEFHRRVRETKLEFAEIGFNTELYWENKDVRRTVSLVPTSAITGEGIPDLLMLLLALPQRLLTERLMFNSMLEATVLEVKVIEGLGTTIDIILTGGTIHEGDTIVVVGLDGPILTAIRALLTPHPMKEMRVKGQYLHHKEIVAAQGIKISAEGLEKAVAGTQLMVVENPNNDDEVEFVRDEVMKDFQTILTNVDKSGLGVYVQASTLGSLEALLEFLRTSKIPVSGINIGPVHKRDVTKASTMLERRKEYATILAFDVTVEKEAQELAEDVGVTIFTADIIYHLFDKFTEHMDKMKRLRREQVNDDVVFPSISRILPQHVYNKKDPIVVGVDVLDGILRVGTPLVVKKGNTWLDIGRVASIELNKKQVMTASKGESVAVKIQDKTTENIMYGRHFDFQDIMYSKMSRQAINLLKENFRDDLQTEDWRLVVQLKKTFNIL